MDNYDDGPDASAPAAQEPDQDDGGHTCLLPTSAFPDAKPGDTITLTVVKIHDNEIEATPAESDNDEDDQGGQEQESDPSSGGGMDEMMQ